MKKAMRKMICMVLVGLLTVSTVVPAMAVSESHTGSLNDYNYTWTATYVDDYGLATINTNTVPTTVAAQVQIETYYELMDMTIGHAAISSSGYASATAIDRDTIEYINGVPVQAVVSGLKASYKIGSNTVEDGHYMGTWLNADIRND